MCQPTGQRGCGWRGGAQVPAFDPPGIINMGDCPRPEADECGWWPRSEWNGDEGEASGCSQLQPRPAGRSSGRAMGCCQRRLSHGWATMRWGCGCRSLAARRTARRFAGATPWPASFAGSANTSPAPIARAMALLDAHGAARAMSARHWPSSGVQSRQTRRFHIAPHALCDVRGQPNSLHLPSRASGGLAERSPHGRRRRPQLPPSRNTTPSEDAVVL